MSDNNLHIGVMGHYTLRRVSGDGEVLEERQFENLILNAGLDRMGVGGYLTTCRVGSGSTPPQVTDTALQSLVASTTNTQAAQGGVVTTSPRYGWYSITYRFEQGAAAGNISEVGVGWGGAGAIFSRALVKDINGNPATIVVASDEFLDVIYEIRFYIPETDQIKLAQNISGTPTDVTIRAGSAASGSLWGTALTEGVRSAVNSAYGTTAAFSGAIGAITGSPSGTSASTTRTNDAYVAGTYRLDGTIVVPLNNGNFAGGIASLYVVGTFGVFQYGFNPPIVKNNTQQVTFRIRATWGRYAP